MAGKLVTLLCSLLSYHPPSLVSLRTHTLRRNRVIHKKLAFSLLLLQTCFCREHTYRFTKILFKCYWVSCKYYIVSLSSRRLNSISKVCFSVICLIASLFNTCVATNAPC